MFRLLFSLPAATLPVKIFFIIVELIRYPHNTLCKVLFIYNEVAAILARLHSDKVLSFMIVLQMSEQLRHGDSLLAGQINAVYEAEGATSFVLTYLVSQKFNL